ncbi:unnamed protein product [Acanthoscelides obtectus]|uniref:Uncharacterized protein n=1 Tax=Acanthoscelides obtectus TaxID=200917 RepID=A0A9P0MJD0_ACAOB|nr:unnamed protein product [Acanthoscelides obtectus]CAK1669141.1 hypothetical protein AOBTE_LOCUS26828 [Acanthoscelides obtectus]
MTPTVCCSFLKPRWNETPQESINHLIRSTTTGRMHIAKYSDTANVFSSKFDHNLLLLMSNCIQN